MEYKEPSPPEGSEALDTLTMMHSIIVTVICTYELITTSREIACIRLLKLLRISRCQGREDIGDGQGASNISTRFSDV